MTRPPPSAPASPSSRPAAPPSRPATPSRSSTSPRRHDRRQDRRHDRPARGRRRLRRGGADGGVRPAQARHGGRQVTLLEADDRLGGHADTHLVTAAGRELAIDTGFIVHNERTYPVLLRLFAELGVETQDSEMSMSVHDEASGLGTPARWGPGSLPEHPQPHRRGVPPDADRDPALPPARRRTPRRRGRPADLATVPRRRRLLRLLRPTLRRGPGRVCVVLRSRGRAGHPPATCSASSTTTACSASSARRGRPSSAGRAATSNGWPRHSTTSAPAPRSPRSSRPRPGRGHPATARSRPTTPWWSPRTPTRRSPCWPGRPPPRPRCCAGCPTPPTRHCCTPTPPCCRERRALARPGTTCARAPATGGSR
ncbi:MAG: FAD-dependent oxidoreductase [Nocardioides sp.]